MTKTKDKDAIVKRVRKCVEAAASADRDNRETGLDDARFIAGRQWTDKEKAARANRPTLTVNRLAGSYRQVTGDLRRTNPAINVMAADSDASPEVAEVIEGLVRHIEQASDATSVYEGTAEAAAACNIGWFRVLADYESDDSFDQELRLERIHNSFSVYCDPAARQPTRADARWLAITEEMDLEDFEAAYPDARVTDAPYDGTTDRLISWQNGETVLVAEYFWKEPQPVTLSLMPDGSVKEGEQAGAIRTRVAQRERVMWAKVSGTEVLEGPQEFPSRYIPVIAVTGEELDLGGEVARSGVATHAKDAQRVYNYWSSTSMEVIALQPKAPWLLTPAQVAGLETYWKQAHTENIPYLPYNPDPDAPIPQRATPPVPSAAILTEIARAGDDIKATTGVYDAALGARSNETSGKAIAARQQESDLSTSIYADNMGKAVAQCGRILVDMIPRIYDTPRTVRIVGKDDVEQMVSVNFAPDPVTGQPQVDPRTQQPIPVLPLTIGKYDVRVSVGPNYSTKRAETAANMVEFVRAYPNAFPLVADLLAKNQDWPDADQFAERFKALLPPNARKPEDMSPEEQQQFAQAMQQQQKQAQIGEAMAQADLQVKQATAAEKMAKAQATVMDAQRPEAAPEQQDPRAAEVELRQALASIAETLARAGLLRAQTEETEAKTLKTTVDALTPPPPPVQPSAAGSARSAR